MSSTAGTARASSGPPVAEPPSPAALIARGLDAHRAGDLAGAALAYRAALALAPAHFDALHLLGALELAARRPLRAIELLERAVALDGQVPLARFNFGLALAADGRHRDALAQFERAVALEPGLPEAWNSRGNALLALGEPEAARASYARALELRPDYPAALMNLATRLQRRGELGEALPIFERAAALAPGPFALAKRVDAAHHACAWDGIARLERELVSSQSETEAAEPFVFLRASADPLEQQRRARAWARQFAGLPALGRDPPRRAGGGRWRIAYCSCDFFTHATAQLLAAVLEAHDRDRFELIAVDWSRDDGSPLRARTLAAFDSVIAARELNDAAVAARVAAEGVDAAIDLKGYTEGSRPGILARRPASVQLSWLGYPGTLGAPWIDYVVADRIVLPPLLSGSFDERVLYLPECYQPNDRPGALARPDRAAHGLPPDAFVFASFNNSYKLSPAWLDCWLELLRAVPRSVLWLFADNRTAAAALGHAVASRGLAERVVFAPRLPPEAHRRRQACADLVLDVLPCGGHTTTSDALAAGVPVLTCAGSTFAGRVAASILTSAGLPELVADSPAHYQALAAALAREPARLADLRRRIAEARERSPLFDPRRFCRHLEAGLAAAIERARSGAPPRTLEVASGGTVTVLPEPARP